VAPIVAGPEQGSSSPASAPQAAPRPDPYLGSAAHCLAILSLPLEDQLLVFPADAIRHVFKAMQQHRNRRVRNLAALALVGLKALTKRVRTSS
jgi:hypothetical protein